MNYQDLSRFVLPIYFRGRSAVMVQLWWLLQALLFNTSPQFAYSFRRWLLRRFGAQIGKSVLIRPSVKITYPWKVKIGDYSWIGDDVVLYSLGQIEVGSNTVISQRSYICAADHDYTKVNFPIRDRKVIIEPEVWIASDVFIGPDVHIGRGSVIGARSSVFEDMPRAMICYGYPCKPRKARYTSTQVINEDSALRH